MNKILRISVALFFILFNLIIFSACDHTDLTGTIHIISDEIGTHEKIPLLLEVPDELSDIHDVMWGVFYESASTIEDHYMIYGDQLEDAYSEDELITLFKTTDINFERIALFLPPKPGNYRIIVDGFYKQTNPQPITEMEIVIE